MNDRYTFNLTFSRAFAILEAEKLIEPGTGEGVRFDTKIRAKVKRSDSKYRGLLTKTIKNRPELFFEVEGYRPIRKIFHESQLKKPVHQMIDGLVNGENRTPYNFRRFFEKIRRESFDKAMSLSQARVESELEEEEEEEDEVMEEVAPEPPAKRRLRSSDVSHENEPSTSASNFEVTASEIWKQSTMSFSSIDTSQEDMRGFNNQMASLAAHQYIFGLISRGMKSPDIVMSVTRFCEMTTDLKGSQPMTDSTIDKKRFCLPTLNSLLLEEKIKASKPSVIVIDDASLVHNSKYTGIVFICQPSEESVLVALYPTFATSGEEMADQTLTRLKELPFWDELRKKIRFLMSDGARAQAKANKIICRKLEEDEGIICNDVYCLMHEVAILEKNTYDKWSMCSSDDLKSARRLHISLMKAFGASSKSLESQHGQSIRDWLDSQMKDWNSRN